MTDHLAASAASRGHRRFLVTTISAYADASSRAGGGTPGEMREERAPVTCDLGRHRPEGTSGNFCSCIDALGCRECRYEVSSQLRRIRPRMPSLRERDYRRHRKEIIS